MAMNMLNFGQYQILNNNTIFKDIMQFAYGSNFENYINENYDSSADYWKVLHDGNVVWDGELDLYDENGQLLHHTDKTSYTKALAEHLGITETEATELMVQAGYEKFVSSENGQPGYFVDANGQKVTDANKIQTSEKFKASYDLQVNYIDQVQEKYGGNMTSAIQDYHFMSLMNETLASSLVISTMMSGLYNFAEAYDDAMQQYGNVGTTNASQQMFNEIAADFDAGIFSNDNAFFKYAKDISPVVGDNEVITTFYYDDNIKNKHTNNLNALAIDYRTFGQTAGIVTTQTEFILTSSSFGKTPLGGYNISTFTDLFKKRYVHMQDKSSAYMMLYSLNNTAKTANIWRYSLPSNYQIGNVAGFNDDHGSGWSGPHSHTEYTRLK